MKKLILLSFITLLFCHYQAQGQNYAVGDFIFDPVRANTLRGSAGISFSSSYKEYDQKIDFKSSLRGFLEYSARRDSYYLGTINYFRNDDSGKVKNASYMAAMMNINCYKAGQGDTLVQRKSFLSCGYIFRNNLERGVMGVHQAVALYQPWGYSSRRFWFSFSLGVAYGHSRWKILDKDLSQLSGAEREKAEFVIANGELRDGNYKGVWELMPTLMVRSKLKISKIISLDVNGTIQQPTRKPYNSVVNQRYNDLARLRPSFMFELVANVHLFDELYLQLILSSNYGLSSPSLFMPKYQYENLIGFSYKF
ncbi:hypothetical protein BN938_2209 [Mucinivorans hirudinis]|uniref:Uncharacterized protein n=1 Tax=Mucinivorans hirudinis TaxID=1433126 RepID=A0A060R9I3_9BACT|nr:hypothetical protein BN938_2209 [Mucinivorans hirudinis]